MYISGQLESQLDALVTHAIATAFASGTVSNLKTHWKHYIMLCLLLGKDPYTVDINLICQYIIVLTQSLTAYQSLKNYISSLKLWFLVHSQDADFMDHFKVRLCLQSAKRQLATVPHAKLPITVDILSQIYQHLDLTDPDDLVLWASFLICFWGMLRKASLVPQRVQDFNPAKHLSRGNIVATDYGLLITLSHSKSNQYGEYTHQIPLTAIPGSPLDPQAAYLHMVQKLPASHCSPAFVFSDGTILTHSLFVKGLRSCLTKINLDPSQYAGHSFRRGSCSFAFKCGIPPDLIRIHGLWRSQAYQSYLALDIKQRLSVTKTMAENL